MWRPICGEDGEEMRKIEALEELVRSETVELGECSYYTIHTRIFLLFIIQYDIRIFSLAPPPFCHFPRGESMWKLRIYLSDPVYNAGLPRIIHLQMHPDCVKGPRLQPFLSP